MKIAGLDIGTTGCKLTVFDETGRMLDKAYRDYPVRRRLSGHEIDLASLMDGVYAVLAEMAARYTDIGAIGVTSFGETFVMTDGSGRPLHDAMLYTDPRGKDECQALCAALGEGEITRLSGYRPHEMYSISKIMWLKKHRPEIFRSAKHIFLIGDYVVWRLTGKAQIDHSLASRTMAFDIEKLAWCETILQAAGIPVSLLSEPVLPGTPAGTVTREAAAESGLDPRCMIVTVSHDQVAAAAGAGAFDGSVAVDGAGTVECLTPVYDSLPEIGRMSRGYFSVIPYIVPGKYVTYAFTYTGGALIQWCLDTFAGVEKEAARQQGCSVHALLERSYTRQGPTGLLVLPHFAGAATPYMDIGSKGAILGLSADTTLPEIYRACMEGVAYEILLNQEALAGSGTHYSRILATGGGAKSAVWVQMKADILNLPMTALETADAGTVGSAMLTGTAIGLYRDLREAASVLVWQKETYLPDPAMHERYMEVFERYRKVYGAVRPLIR